MHRRISCPAAMALAGWIVCAGLAQGADDEGVVLVIRVPGDAQTVPSAGEAAATAPRPDGQTPTPAAPDRAGNPESVVERYPDGKVKVQREVTLDDAYNYVNHGAYQRFGPDGKLLRGGRFRMGRIDGPWTQTIDGEEGDLFLGDLAEGFVGPFLSEAAFQDGRLHGAWTIRDHDGRKIIQWNFQRGIRHGPTTAWYPGGKPRAEVVYRNGMAQGGFREWNPQGELLRTTTLVDGRPLVHRVQWYTEDQKAYEGTVLASQTPSQPAFDWWNSRVVFGPAAAELPEVKHGPWTVWHASGRKKFQGVYLRGVPMGQCTWWHENGQVRAQGQFEDGLPSGTWIAWHENGMKKSLAEYDAGQVSGPWMRWEADGRLVRNGDATLPPAVAPLAREPEELAAVGTAIGTPAEGRGRTGAAREPPPADRGAPRRYFPAPHDATARRTPAAEDGPVVESSATR